MAHSVWFKKKKTENKTTFFFLMVFLFPYSSLNAWHRYVAGCGDWEVAETAEPWYSSLLLLKTQGHDAGLLGSSASLPAGSRSLLCSSVCYKCCYPLLRSPGCRSTSSSVSKHCSPDSAVWSRSLISSFPFCTAQPMTFNPSAGSDGIAQKSKKMDGSENKIC